MAAVLGGVLPRLESPFEYSALPPDVRAALELLAPRIVTAMLIFPFVTVVAPSAVDGKDTFEADKPAPLDVKLATLDCGMTLRAESVAFVPSVALR